MAEDRGFNPDSTDRNVPPVNIWKTDDGKLIHQFSLPGFEEAGISVTFRGDAMVLKARLPGSATESEGQRFQRRDFTLCNIDRQEYPVPTDIWDQEKTKAVLRNGILTVTVPAKVESEGSDGVRIEIIREGN
jgi:HSP20 family molecular chaperone IbpA